MNDITPNELKIMFEDFNKRTDEKFSDREKKNDERHEVYKEERREIKTMLEQINKSLKSLDDSHSKMETNYALLIDWSVEAKKAIEANSAGVSSLQKRDYMVMGAVAIIFACGVWVLSLWEKNLRQDILKENGEQTYEVVQRVFDERVEKVLKANQ